MRSNEVERELSKGIDRLIEDMGELYCGSLKEEALIERRMRDIAFREQLVDQIKKLVSYRKRLEALSDAGLGKDRYIVCLAISTDLLSAEVLKS